MTVLLAAFITVISIVFLILGTVVTLVLKDAATKEAEAVLPELTRGILDRARNQLPEEARERFEEEWPAEFKKAIEKRPAWALMEALSLYKGARQMARNLEPTLAPVPAEGQKWNRRLPGAESVGRWAASLQRLSRRRLMARSMCSLGTCLA